MPVITLTSDIGQEDFIIGAVKGQILSIIPGCAIADITHQLSSKNYLQGAYIFNNAAKHYPGGTVHIVMVNFFQYPQEHVLFAHYNGHLFVVPDNGFLTMMLGLKPKDIVKIDIKGAHTFVQITERIVESVAYFFASGNLADAGEPATEILEIYPTQPKFDANWMEGQIIFIDQFENVVVNIRQEEFEAHAKGRPFKIVFTRNETIEVLSRNYGAVPIADKLAWFNSAGYLEISVRGGNMAGLFGLSKYDENQMSKQRPNDNKWFFQMVRVFFE
jgi:S-adenosylmethionine hydrolase